MTEKLTEELHHDLWGISKSITPMSPEESLEAWRKTVAVLEALCPVAEALRMETLLLALADAADRADEEAVRALDRLERPEGAQLSQSEAERLRGLMHRADALTSACAAVEDWAGTDDSYRARTLAALGPMRVEAHEAFLRYRREVGLPE
jgi:hypothetical protein